MLLRGNGSLRGLDINITAPSDVLGPISSLYACSFQFAYPKVFFANCNFNNVLTANMVTARDNDGVNDQNAGLRIIDPRDPVDNDGNGHVAAFMAEKGVDVGEIDPDEWCILQGLTLDFCNVPVYIFGRGNSIDWYAPQMTREYTLDEWRMLEDALGLERLQEALRDAKDSPGRLRPTELIQFAKRHRTPVGGPPKRQYARV